jgi:head-tail adaptor
MLKWGPPTTPIRIQSKIADTNDNAVAEITWTDIIAEDIKCEWQNKFGGKFYEAAAVKAKEPATLRLWYIPGITPDCRVVRKSDNAAFDIINIDDVKNRHMVLEIEVKRSVAG